jgi:hypothetical protein
MQALRYSVLLLVISAPSQDAFAITFTSLDFPGATYTELSSIDGNNIVGHYADPSGAQHGFLYDGVNWTTLDVPFIGNYETRALGVSGSRIVGRYLPGPHGFSLDGATWTPLDYPGSNDSSNQAVDGNNIVGLAGSTGFLHDGATWTPLAYPGSLFTNPLGIDGNNIVGFYQVGDFFAPRHGFVYDGTVWDALDYPGSVATEAHGIDGNTIVGTWWDSTESHGFIFDGASWQSFDYPGSIGAVANDISGNRIVGTYFDVTGNAHNFLATIPEPTTIVLLALGAAGALSARRRRARQSSITVA